MAYCILRNETKRNGTKRNEICPGGAHPFIELQKYFICPIFHFAQVHNSRFVSFRKIQIPYRVTVFCATKRNENCHFSEGGIGQAQGDLYINVMTVWLKQRHGHTSGPLPALCLVVQ